MAGLGVESTIQFGNYGGVVAVDPTGSQGMTRTAVADPNAVAWSDYQSMVEMYEGAKAQPGSGSLVAGIPNMYLILGGLGVLGLLLLMRK